jgi:DeoR/GlpR family transcriptional regulator of sugar metabolism
MKDALKVDRPMETASAVGLEGEEIEKVTRSPMTLYRRAQIADTVRQRGVARVSELADLFQVSEVTIRNDLIRLEQEGQLVRDRGGAIAIDGTSNTNAVHSLLSVEHRSVLHHEEKQRIARVAAQMVKPGDTIIMDAGTTVVEMAPHLSNVSPLTVVTNALNVATEMGASTNAQIILLGGTLSRESSSTVGPLAEQSLNGMVVQKLFLGTQALDLDNGLTDTTLEIAQVKREMIRAARQVILLTDSSKWGSAGFIKVVPLTAVHTVITDTNLPDDARAAVERLDIHLILV